MLLKLPTTTDLQDGQLANQLYCIPAKRIQRHSSAYQTHDKPQLLCGDAVRVYRRQQVTMPSGPFKPAFGGKILPVGCSDKTPRSHYGKEGKAEGPKFTTYSRTTAAIEQYWQDRAANAAAAHPAPVSSPTKAPSQPTSNVPGGEAALAHKTREACWKDSVQLGHQPDRFIPTCQGTPADIEEKEVARTRGITGFTGKQPPPGYSKPPPAAPDTSGWVAINAFDERRPRVKGIPGYTGHQPPSPDKRGAAAAAAGDASWSDQVFDHSTHAWIPNPAAAQHAQQYHHLYMDQPATASPAGPNISAKFAPAAPAAQSGTYTASSSDCSQSWMLQAGQFRPWSGPGAAAAAAAAGSEAPSTPYSPRFFMNGEELPVEHVPVPATAQPRTQGSICQVGAAVPNGASSSCRCCCQQQQQQPQTGGQQVGDYGVGSTNMQPSAVAKDTQTRAVAASRQRPGSALSALPRTRQTTYTSAFTPSAGFGQLVQQQMSSLQLNSSSRPASAAAAYAAAIYEGRV